MPLSSTNLEQSPTPDPCAQENLPGEIGKINQLMLEFDKMAAAAASTSREELTEPIAELQSIRRAAEDQPAPACLKELKEIQLAHMNAVIETLMAFLDGANKETTNKGISIARQLHNQYLAEMGRLLGATVSPINEASPP